MNFLNLIKNIYKQCTPNTLRDVKNWTLPTYDWEQGPLSPLPDSISYRKSWLVE